jgi:hypothetical protein
MSSAFEIAFDVLSAFGQNVVARKPPLSYGSYARLIGRAPSKDGLAIGKAMHAIGAICVVRALPVAPLHWVKREGNGERHVFESDPLERHYILEQSHYDTMFVVAREYRYSEQDFDGIEKALRVALASENPRKWSPHKLWHRTFVTRPKDSELTYFELAMRRYEKLLAEFRAERAAKRGG